MPRVTPERLANLFTESGSTAVVLKSNADILGVDSFQVGFGTDGTGSVEVDYTYLGHLSVDLTDYTEMRMSVNVIAAGIHTETMKMQYASDYTTFIDIGDTISLTSVGLKRTAWAALPADANTVVGVRVGKGGGNAEDPVTLSATILQFRR